MGNLYRYTDRKDGGKDMVFEEFVDLIEACKLPRTSGASHWSDDTDPRRVKQFYYTKNFAEANTFAVEGFPEIESKMKGFQTSAMDAVTFTGLTWEPVYDVAGDEMDIDRFLTGQPEMMYTCTPSQSRGRRIVNITMNVSCASNIDAEYIMRRGVACLVLIDMLERSGLRVNLTANMSVGSRQHAGHGLLVITVPVKKAEEALDLARIAYVAHPSFLRRHMLRLMEILPAEDVRKYGAGCGGGDYYGYPTDDEEVRQASDIYLRGMDAGQFRTNEACVEWIKTQVRRIREESEKAA